MSGLLTAVCSPQHSAWHAVGAQWIFRRINDQSLLLKSLGEGPGNCGFHSFPVKTSRWLVPAVVDLPLRGDTGCIHPATCSCSFLRAFGEGCPGEGGWLQPGRGPGRGEAPGGWDGNRWRRGSHGGPLPRVVALEMLVHACSPEAAFLGGLGCSAEACGCGPGCGQWRCPPPPGPARRSPWCHRPR